MRFQFSMLTMLVCTAVLAVVFAACLWIKVGKSTRQMPWGSTMAIVFVEEHAPTPPEFLRRAAWAAPLALCTTFAALWFARKLRPVK